MSAKDTPIIAGLFDGRVTVAKQFSIKPLIPARPQGKPVVLYGYSAKERKRLTAYIGAVPKNRPRGSTEALCPSLHIDLWQLILALLSLWHERPLGAGTIDIPAMTVWRRFSGSNSIPGEGQRASLLRLWDELHHLLMSVDVEGAESSRAVEVVRYEGDHRKINNGHISTLSFKEFAFDQRFLDVVQYAHQTQDIRLDVLAPITSPFVRAAYLWLPALACRVPCRMRPIQDCEIPVGPALQAQLVGVPSTEFFSMLGVEPLPRCKRKQRLIQHGERSILWQLHGLSMLRQGLSLGVTSWDAEDDFYVGAYTFVSPGWTPPKGRNLTRSMKKNSIMDYFVTRGRGSKEAFVHWINDGPWPTIDPYQIERLHRAGITPAETKRDTSFYRMVCALVGPDRFQKVVGYFGEATADSSPAGLFRTLLLDEVALVAEARTEAFNKLFAGSGQGVLALPGAEPQ